MGNDEPADVPCSLFEVSTIDNISPEIAQKNTILEEQKRSSKYFVFYRYYSIKEKSKKRSTTINETNGNQEAVDSLLYQLRIQKKSSRRDLRKRRPAETEIITPYTKHRGNSKAIHNLIRSRRRVVKLLIILVVLFLFSWLPYHAISFTIDLLLYWDQMQMFTASTIFSNKIILNDEQLNQQSANSKFISTYIYPIALCLALANSATNPVCYIALSHGFKNMFKSSFKRFFNCFSS